MDDSIPDIPVTPLDTDAIDSNTSDSVQMENETAEQKQTAFLTLVRQLHDEAETSRAALLGSIGKTPLPLEIHQNIVPIQPTFGSLLKSVMDAGGFSESINATMRASANRLSAAISHQIANAASESLKQVSLRWLNDAMVAQRETLGRIIDASAVIRIPSLMISGSGTVHPPPAAIYTGTGVPSVNVYEETGTATIGLHASGAVEVIASDGAHLTESASIEIIAAGIQSGELFATGTLTTTVIRGWKPKGERLSKLTAHLQEPARIILSRLAAHKRGLPLPGLHQCEYALRSASAEEVALYADGVLIASVTYVNGRLIACFQSIALTYYPRLIESDCLHIWSDIQQHLVLAHGALIAEVRALALPAPAQADQQHTQTNLLSQPTERNLALPPIEDPTDKRIYDIVSKDPSLTDKEVGAQVGLNRQAVNTRRRKLESMGYTVRRWKGR